MGFSTWRFSNSKTIFASIFARSKSSVLEVLGNAPPSFHPQCPTKTNLTEWLVAKFRIQQFEFSIVVNLTEFTLVASGMCDKFRNCIKVSIMHHPWAGAGPARGGPIIEAIIASWQAAAGRGRKALPSTGLRGQPSQAPESCAAVTAVSSLLEAAAGAAGSTSVEEVHCQALVSIWLEL